ncbi:Hypothetical_protein [Hexamita inflata]|uniref:Hypothetical_protein n=1 Tax=Hexamita inflata TaxID=28002 RepID=A0AA86QB28_9EUKA|nr:Hypothetical protein HINF_LOCUS43501 [Hexamita inflata]CAI9955859.1 Hypothetical protein HINF_LOCUS43504 [Hexamita inflata]
MNAFQLQARLLIDVYGYIAQLVALAFAVQSVKITISPTIYYCILKCTFVEPCDVTEANRIIKFSRRSGSANVITAKSNIHKCIQYSVSWVNSTIFIQRVDNRNVQSSRSVELNSSQMNYIALFSTVGLCIQMLIPKQQRRPLSSVV